uniref:CUE domain-containing protein n=2 Tax=Leptocylindrus danicus TaxID=163516 RepID=A0A7S2KPA8_9STRA
MTGSNHSATTPAAASKPEPDGLQGLINQVLDIFPDLGEGYIEAALACYKGDVSRTISALFEDDLHPQLKAIDKKLGARKKESAGKYDATDDLEAIETQKKLIQRMQKEEENQAFMLSSIMEYNDDYDDQFDDVGDDSGAGGGAIGNSDGGMYADVDYDAIRRYNQVSRGIEEEELFWDNMRNTNRGVKPPADELEATRSRLGRPDAAKTDNDSSKKKKSQVRQTRGENKPNAKDKKVNTPSTKQTPSGGKGKAKTCEEKAKAGDATFTKADKRRSEARKRAQQKHNKARAMRKLG